MGLLGWILAIIGFIILMALCRILREKYEIVDVILLIVAIISVVIVWIMNGFWAALLCLVVEGIFAAILFGVGSSTEVHKFGHTYSLTCNKCGYHDLEIVEHTKYGVITRCKRCGALRDWVLNH